MTTYNSATAMAAAAMACMAAGTASADVTPAGVWDDWSSYMADLGFEVTAEETQQGDTLKLSDIVARQELDETDTTTEVTLPGMTLTDNGDGTVSITFPEEMPVSIVSEGEEPVQIDLLYASSDMDITVSGDDAEMTYAYAAATLAVSLEDFSADGEATEVREATIEMTDVKGRTISTSGDPRHMTQSFTTGPVTYALGFDEPEEDSSFDIEGRTDTVSMTSSMALPDDADIENMPAMFDAGFGGDFSYSVGAGTSDMTFVSDGSTTTAKTSSTGGELTGSISGDRVSYGGATNDLEVEVAAPFLPDTVKMAMKEARVALDVPIAETDAMQDFGLTYVLADLTVSDSVWALFDPTGKLPRDPATLALELDGKARLKVDLTDPTQMDKVHGAEMPADLETLSLDRLLLRIAGAELTGEGDLTFDNSDRESFGGMPKPIGDVGLKLTGGNGLLDNLVAMGLVPEEQLMGVRMMMGMVAVPGEGEDVLKSDIEFTEDGKIMANGQRLK